MTYVPALRPPRRPRVRSTRSFPVRPTQTDPMRRRPRDQRLRVGRGRDPTDPGHPRPYHFPPFERAVLANGLNVLTVHLPGRPLVNAQLVLLNGAADEPATEAGATVLRRGP